MSRISSFNPPATQNEYLNQSPFDFRFREDLPTLNTQAGNVLIEEAGKRAFYQAPFSGLIAGGLIGLLTSALMQDSRKINPEASAKIIGLSAASGVIISTTISPILARSEARSSLARKELGMREPVSVYQSANNIDSAMAYSMINSSQNRRSPQK